VSARAARLAKKMRSGFGGAVVEGIAQWKPRGAAGESTAAKLLLTSR